MPHFLISKRKNSDERRKNAGIGWYCRSGRKSLSLAQNLAGADNAEIHLLKKMSYSLRMMVNPAQRYMTDGARAADELNIAEKLDPRKPKNCTYQSRRCLFYSRTVRRKQNQRIGNV